MINSQCLGYVIQNNGKYDPSMSPISLPTRGFMYRVLLIILVTVGVAANAFAWTARHNAEREPGGSVDKHYWRIKPEGATIKDIHICLQTVPDNKVDANGNGTVTRAENAAFEADLLNDWRTPRIRSGPGNIEVNWDFSVTRNRNSGKVYLNFYGTDPLPGNQETRFDLRLTDNANQFKKGPTSASVTYADAKVIATSDGDQSTDGAITDGTKEDVGGPILLAALVSDNTMLWGTALMLLVVLVLVIAFMRKRKKPNEREEKQ